MTLSYQYDTQVLITGATGFIGAHCILQLLEKNVRVKIAIRSHKKYMALKECFSDDIGKLALISPAYIQDITNYEEIVEAVKGCDGVLHLASPYTYDVSDNVRQLLKPAVLGTKTILKAALTESKIKRVVITSSFASVFDASKGLQPGVVLSEKDFSPLTWEDGANTRDPAVAYRASKIVAERAAWDFVSQENPHFDISVICPPMVFGPLLSTKLIDSVDDLNFSNTVIWKIANSSSKTAPVPPTKGPVWVDVRDLAAAHVEAFWNPKASNSRYMVSAGDFDNQEIADILREHFPISQIRENIPVGQPGARLTGKHFTTDSTKAIDELLVTFRPLKESVIDLSVQLYNYVYNL